MLRERPKKLVPLTEAGMTQGVANVAVWRVCYMPLLAGPPRSSNQEDYHCARTTKKVLPPFVPFKVELSRFWTQRLSYCSCRSKALSSVL